MNPSATPAPWVLVCGGFHCRGGIDRANLALAEALLEQGRDVYLIGHDFEAKLLDNPRVHATRLPRPLGFLMAERSLRRAGLRVAAEVTRKWPGARVVVNGGNCPWPDINWVHSVHAAWPREDEGAPLWFRAKSRFAKEKARHDEVVALQRAKLVIANSERTRRDLITLGIPSEKIRVIYLGSEPDWEPATATKREEAREAFNLPADTKVVGFVGALGYDRNKGFDTLLAAWSEARMPNAVLIAAGGGRGFQRWQREIGHMVLHGSVRLLGFTDRVGEMLAASDLFVSPVRYEAFGLNVLEAICRGVPAMVSHSAGVAEVYPPELSRYLLENPEDVRTLGTMLTTWSNKVQPARDEFAGLRAKLRSYTMRDLAQAIIAAAEGSNE